MELTNQVVATAEGSPVTVVTLTGDIDGSTAPQAQAEVLGLMNPGIKIVLDMKGVGYLSSAGLRMLLLTYRTVVGRGGQAALAGLSSDLQDTMSLTGFLDFFQHYPTVEAAVAALN
jgi:anti-sigma B factor antagonist